MTSEGLFEEVIFSLGLKRSSTWSNISGAKNFPGSIAGKGPEVGKNWPYLMN